MSIPNLLKRDFDTQLALTGLDTQNPVEMENFPDTPEKVVVLAIARLIDRKKRAVDGENELQTEAQRLRAEWEKAEDERISSEWIEFDGNFRDREKILADRKEQEAKALEEYFKLPETIEKQRLIKIAQENPQNLRDWIIKAMVEAPKFLDEDAGTELFDFVYCCVSREISFDLKTEAGRTAIQEFYGKHLLQHFEIINEEWRKDLNSYVTMENILIWDAFFSKHKRSIMLNEFIEYVTGKYSALYRKDMDGRPSAYTTIGDTGIYFNDNFCNNEDRGISLFGAFTGQNFYEDSSLETSINDNLDLLFPNFPYRPSPIWPDLPDLPEKPVRRATPDFETKVKDETKKTEEPAEDEVAPAENLGERFPKVVDQLEVTMQRLAINGQVNKVLEDSLFGESRPIAIFITKYEQAPEYFGVTKADLRKNLDYHTIPHIQQELACLHQILAFRAGVLERVKILEKSGFSKKKQSEADLLREVALVYAELADNIAIELEMKIRCKELAIPDLGGIVETMEHLGATGERALEILQSSFAQAQAAKEVVYER